MTDFDLNRAVQVMRALLAAALLAVAAVPVAAFHFPWDQGHDTTASNDPPNPGPCEGGACDDDCNSNSSRSPVYAALGHAIWRSTDVVLRGRPYVGIYRVYNSNDPVVGLFGNGWSVCFDVALYPAHSSGVRQRIYKAPNGKRFVYERQADGSYKAPAGRFETLVEGASVVTMTMLDGRRNVFALDGRLLERQDSNGNRVAFTYDASTRPVRMADDDGRFLTIAYNGAGLVDAVTDHAGRTWRYGYDVNANLASVTDPAGGVMRYAWQAYRPSGDAQTYSQLLSVVDASGVVLVSFTYSGNQVASYTEGANRITYTRPTTNTRLAGTVTQRDSLNVTTTFTYGALGLVTRDVDGLGGATSYTYDANGRITAVVDALNRTWASSYDALGRLTSIANPLSQTSMVQYAGSDPRPIKTTTPSGRVLTMSYDAHGNPLAIVDAAGAATRIAYNVRGDAVGVVNALGQQTSIDYNAVGLPLRAIDALDRQSTLTYDALGRAVTATNAAGETTRFGYDALDRIVSVVDPLNQTTALTYDAAGRLLSVTDAKSSLTRYEYDAFGRRTAAVAPDLRRTTYAYRADNLLATITWPDNTTISYLYDNNKRITRETAGSEAISYSYNAVNQFTSATGPGGTVSYTYDNAGRVITETSGGRTNTVARNAEGERIRLDYLGQSQSYTRDGRGLVTRISSPAGNFDFSFDALGRRSRLTYPNGSTASYVFDSAGQLTNLTHAGVFNAPYVYTHDAAGRITRITGDGPDWNYDYDALGRLTRATQGTSVYIYTLDQVGNILDGGRSYDVNHRLVSDASKTYSYDQRGNLTLEQDRTTGARTTYSWNVKNQLLRVDFFANVTSTTPTRTLQFSYDPLGRRASKTDGSLTRRFVYDGDDLIGTLDGTGTVVASNVFSGVIDEPLASMVAGVPKTLYANHTGSVMAISDAGSLTHSFRYGPFGETHSASSPDSVEFRYVGREKDTDSLYYYRARYYHAGLQRFLSTDPLGVDAGANPYRYVKGNPVIYRDPRGLILDTILDIGFIAYDLYRIGRDNIFANCDNLGENLTALGADIAGAAIPLATGGGAGVRAASKYGDDAIDAIRHADDIPASTPVGRRGSPLDVAPGTNSPTSIGGREYSGHALDRMQGRGVTPSVVEDAISNGSRTAGNTPGTTVHTSTSNGVTVVTNSEGRVITVITTGRK